MYLGLITRCKDEFFIEEFCKYYLSQGVDEIYIIDYNSEDKTIYNNLINNKKVKIIYEDKKSFSSCLLQMEEVNKLYKNIKNNFEWIISVDVDEFITTKKNISNTIKDELFTTFKMYDCIKIPWVMMSGKGVKNNPNSILRNNINRWNHDLKHPNTILKFRCRYKKIEVKCIFKTTKFTSINIHTPIGSSNAKVVNSINLKKSNLNPYYENLREDDIKIGYLLCYHYRIISEENTKSKLKKLQYKSYNLKKINSSDYSEILDETLKNKSLELDKSLIINHDCYSNETSQKKEVNDSDYLEILK